MTHDIHYASNMPTLVFLKIQELTDLKEGLRQIYGVTERRKSCFFNFSTSVVRRKPSNFAA